MSSLRALYFDGRTSAPGEVEIRVDSGDQILVQGHGVDLRYPLSKVDITPRVANIARTIALPNGGLCEVRDNDALERLLPASSGRRLLDGLIHRLESRLTLVLAAVAVAGLVAWAGIEHGIPYLAKGLAHSLPTEVDRSLGQGALQGLDQLFFHPSQLDPSKQQDLQEEFATLADAALLGDQARLEFRSSPILGANALALPSGIVVMTDELVVLTQQDEELLAVLAHELGHIQGRHALRGVLQASITPVLIATVTGDLASISALAGALPTILVEMKYSRVFELEADSFAVELMTRRGIPPYHLANVLQRLTGAESEDEPLGDYLSTHPATNERIERITAP